MGNKHLHSISRLFVGLIAGAALFSGVTVTASAAEYQYISAISTASGEKGEDSLIDKGCTVLHPMVSAGSGDSFWIGSQLTSDSSKAITSLQYNADGTFSWKTGGEKAPVLSLYYMSSEVSGADFSVLMPIANNGAVAVPNQNGDPAVFQTEKGQGYLGIIRQDVWKNYVGSLVTASAVKKKDAVTQLYKSGCEYYVDKNLSGDESKVTYLGYTRTAQTDKAVTDILVISDKQKAPEGYEAVGSEAIAGGTLYFTRSAKLGNPVIDLEPIESGKGVELGGSEAALMIDANSGDKVTKPYILQDEEYQKLSGGSERFMMSDIIREDCSAAGLSFVSAKEGLAAKQKKRYSLLGIKVAPGEIEEQTSAIEETTSPEDEPDGIVLKDEEDEEAGEETLSSDAGTAYSNPGGGLPLPAVIIPLCIVVAIPIATILIRKRILKEQGGSNDKK